MYFVRGMAIGLLAALVFTIGISAAALDDDSKTYTISASDADIITIPAAGDGAAYNQYVSQNGEPITASVEVVYIVP